MITRKLKNYNHKLTTKQEKETKMENILTPKAERLLKYLKKKRNHSITSIEAFERLGETRLSATIYLLRKKYLITDEYLTSTNRFGDTVKFKKYTLQLGNE